VRSDDHCEQAGLISTILAGAPRRRGVSGAALYRRAQHRLSPKIAEAIFDFIELFATQPIAILLTDHAVRGVAK
jgi:hypothetical protein